MTEFGKRGRRSRNQFDEGVDEHAIPHHSIRPAEPAVASNGDKQIVCSDCKAVFMFTEGEQHFFKERGFKEPRRCKNCRDNRKAQKNNGQQQQQGGNYDQQWKD